MADPDSIQELMAKVVKFRDERDWKQFHSLKNLATALNVEAAEVLELFQWTDEPRLPDELPGELADVFYHLLLLAHEAGVDLGHALIDKQKLSAAKYPIDKAKGSPKKYTEL